MHSAKTYSENLSIDLHFPGIVCYLSECFSCTPAHKPAHLRRWTFGADRVQLNAELKILSEFLSHLQVDVVRGLPSISSLAPQQCVTRKSCKLCGRT